MDIVLSIYVNVVLSLITLTAVVSALAYRYQRNDARRDAEKYEWQLAAQRRLLRDKQAEADYNFSQYLQYHNYYNEVHADLVACRTALSDKAAQVGDLLDANKAQEEIIRLTAAWQ